ncbi:DUF4169 family protein [Flaviflagellibacter deserti]|uniref:DUF4169 family protein n=1 Tax=Flaviflagellibacter deserti TaxID=2267266 RepID=A0ABV9Z8K6_9HYPH
MADLINLNRFRKDKARADKKAKATENRAAFGRTKTEKSTASAREEQARRLIDQHRIDKDPE